MKSFAVVAVAIATMAPGVHAQSTRRDSSAVAKPPARADGGAFTANEMKDALIGLVQRQEEYFTSHEAYASDLSQLAPVPLTGPVPNLTIIDATSNAWSARAVDPTVPGKSCVIFVGPEASLRSGVPKTNAQARKPVQEAKPVCDDHSRVT